MRRMVGSIHGRSSAHRRRRSRPGLPGRIATLALMLALLPALVASAGSPVPYGGEYREDIETAFFDVAPGAKLGTVSQSKVRDYRSFIEKKKRVLEEHVYNYETIERGKSEKAARRTIKRLDRNIALDYILGLLDRMRTEIDPVAAYDLGSEILMVEWATRMFTEPLGSVKIPVHMKNSFMEWRVENRSRARKAGREAHNLVNRETGEFYTSDELADLIRSGFDISTLDPPDQTHFWQKNDIASLDIVDSYLNGGDQMHAGLQQRFPAFDGAVVEFDKPHMTQSKPKLDIRWKSPECLEATKKQQKKCEQRMKLKFGMETHADPVANALLRAIGFNADASMHVRNVRVNLGDKTRDEVEADWIGYFDRQRIHTYIPIDTVLKPGEAGRGEDEQGEYFVFQTAVAEDKPRQIDRIGQWTFSWGLAEQSREARGLFVFNAWIANADMKDEENNKLVLRNMPDGEQKMFLVQQDVGHSFGWILPERAEAYSWDLIETNATSKIFGWVNGSIEFNYINLQDAALEHTTTYADAKWMTRRIAQLSRKQIEDAVALGGWPGGIPQLYVEKMINRRNQLVQAFDLEAEYPLLPVDRQITTLDGSVVDGHLAQNRFEDISQLNYDNHWADGFGPINRWIADRAMQAIQLGISAVDVINPGTITLTGNLAVFPRILLNLTRQVILNPKPQGALDQYIVVDSVEFGVRVGVGYIGSVESTVVQKFALAFPVPTQHKGLLSAVRVFDFLLPASVRTADLPEQYVLFREGAFKSGVRISTDHSDFLSPFGIDGDQNWVMSRRSVIDHRGEEPLVWVDHPRSLERDAHLFLEAAVLQIPFLGGHTSDGKVSGAVWRIDKDKLEVPGADGTPIFEKMVQSADFSEASKIVSAPERKASSEFHSREVWWNLLVANWRSRTSDETIVVKNPLGEIVHEEHQSERRRRLGWSFFDNGETQEFRVTGFVGADDPVGATIEEPVVVIKISIDDLNTHSDEFEQYFRMLERLGSGQHYLSREFEPKDWEVTGASDGRWTRMRTDGSIHLYYGALQRLMRVDEAGFWNLLGANLGMTPKEFARQRELARVSSSKSDLVARRSPKRRLTRSIIRRAQATLEVLRESAAGESNLERMSLLVEALYRSIFKIGQAYDPVILATLLEQSGAAEMIENEEIAIKARVSKAFEDENNMPERRNIVGHLGAPTDFEPIRYRFFPFGGIEFYNMLNWVNEIE
jgi:hypothetical protein